MEHSASGYYHNDIYWGAGLNIPRLSMNTRYVDMKKITTKAVEHYDEDEPQQDIQTNLWTVREAASYFNVSEKTIRRDIEEGTIPHFRIRNCIRLHKQALVDQIEAQTRYNSMCVGSAVQGASTCHISASKREVKAGSGEHRSPTHTANELGSLLEQRKREKP